MSTVYVQKTYPIGIFAKMMTEESEIGKPLYGWELVCIHSCTYYHQGEVTEYVATFRKEVEP